MTLPRLLIVEDNLDYQELYQDVLAEEYALSFAADKESALALLATQRFDVALVDVRLREQETENRDGLLVAEAIRAQGHPTAILLKSGFPLESQLAPRIEALHLFAVLDKSAAGQLRELRALLAQATEDEGRKTKYEGTAG